LASREDEDKVLFDGGLLSLTDKPIVEGVEENKEGGVSVLRSVFLTSSGLNKGGKATFAG